MSPGVWKWMDGRMKSSGSDGDADATDETGELNCRRPSGPSPGGWTAMAQRPGSGVSGFDGRVGIEGDALVDRVDHGEQAVIGRPCTGSLRSG